MPLSWALFARFLLAAAGYIVGRSRAFATAGPDVRKLHSRPAYHGASVGLAALLPALAVYAWRSDRRRRDLALLGVPVAVFLLYPLVLELWLGHGLSFVDAQRIWERSLAPLGPLGGLVQAIGEGDVLGPLLAVALLALALVAWRRMGAPYGVYALAALTIPMALPSERLGGLYSFPRLALAAFPCLLALALLGRDRRIHLAAFTVLAAWLAVNVVRWAL